MAEPALTLQYADVPTRWGVTSDRQPDRLRVVVPPVPTWKHLPRNYYWGVLPLVVSVSMFVMALHTREMLAAIPSICMYFLGFLAVLMLALHRLYARTLFDVTSNGLAITSVAPWAAPRSVRWRLSEIGEVKLNPYTGRMLVRITGKGLPEFYISPNREVSQWVVDTLREAAFNSTFAPQSDGHDCGIPRQPNHARFARIATIVASALGLIGIVLAIMYHTLPIGAVLIMVAAFIGISAAGISRGTQERKFFT